MRSLLLHAHQDENFEGRLQVTLDLARAFDAHITLLQPIAFNVLLPGDFYGITALDTAPLSRELAKNFRAEIEPRVAAEGVRWDWVDEFGLADTKMLEHAALADLAVVGATSGDEGLRKGPSPLVGILAVHCKAPVLVVPDGAKGIALGKPVMVCWNGSLEASRALRAAVPLMQAASAVYLVSVDAHDDDDGGMLPVLAGARYLDRHGVKCELVELKRGTSKVSDVLRDVARARGVGLMVMGAYGQPRLIETLFGGVTQKMLTDPELPILISH